VKIRTTLIKGTRLDHHVAISRPQNILPLNLMSVIKLFTNENNILITILPYNDTERLLTGNYLPEIDIFFLNLISKKQ
jgi:hypothetical protein